MRLTRSQGLPRAVLSAAVSLLAAPLTQRRPPQGLTFRSPALPGFPLRLRLLLPRPLRLPSWLPCRPWMPPGLCSILFLTGWQGLLFLPWRMFRYVMRLTRPQGLPRAVLSAAPWLLAAPLTQWRPPQGLTFHSPVMTGFLLRLRL